MTSKAARMHEFHFGRHDGDRDGAGHHSVARREDAPVSSTVSTNSLVSGKGRWIAVALGLATLVGAAALLNSSRTPVLVERTRAPEVTGRWEVDPTIPRAHATQAIQALSTQQSDTRAALTPATTTSMSEPIGSGVPAAPATSSTEPRGSSTPAKSDNPYSSAKGSRETNDNPY